MKADPSRYLEFRRDIHRHPELSNQEVETTRRIREFLARDGLELCPIGALNGGFVRINAGKARTLCMRADIDALPLTEHTGAPFSSVHEGVMHACGHDMHTAIAAGIACELNRVKDRLNCNILVLFQPAEEANPVGGARPVTEAGFLTDQHIDEMYGLHMWPSLPVGDIELRPGPIMAASDRFRIEVLGTAAHAAEPHLGVDAIVIGSEIDCAWSRSSGGRSIPSSPSPSLSAPSRPLGATMWSVTGPSWTERSGPPVRRAETTSTAAFGRSPSRSPPCTAGRPRWTSRLDTASSATHRSCSSAFPPMRPGSWDRNTSTRTSTPA